MLTIYLTDDWLAESGIVYLTQFPLYLAFITSFGFFFMGVTFLFYYFTKIKFMFYLGASVSFISVAINFYKGMVWLLSPEQFFLSLENQWVQYINTARLVPIQHKLRCCGFRMIHDVPGDMCRSSDKNPCYRILVNHYSANVRSCGAFALICAGAHAFLIVLFFMSTQQLMLKSRIII